ncbi:type II toxin-antitoxin system VapC family toxin [Phenylobacterium sp.]|uniref:type II toxin-antitoxin system VapC family toxin n=1 Tax=Phenylobacterium sp. TaxID=1871053 RepID=UPI002735799A|nr:type II toxin-antitoxin system VapC family toxin [Phenylobacterium sp.]MDP3852341.1 type II toxin-antitoxin system VapC family toxin [Phenylobacterium sp.]
MILLDTCALLWIVGGDPIEPEATAEIEALWAQGHVPWVSPISAWEVGLLSARARISLTMPPERWWAAAVSRSGFEVAAIPPETLIASSFLPGAPPNDPADRIIAATAREGGLRVMTRDAKLLAYAAAGHIDAIAC